LIEWEVYPSVKDGTLITKILVDVLPNGVVHLADKDGDTPTSESAPKDGDVMVEDQSRGRPAADMVTGTSLF
jgi:hypothetical protein